MAAVYVNNLVINAGSDFSQFFTLEGSLDNSELNLSGYTVTAQMRKWSGSSSYISFTTEIESPASDGRISLKLNSTETLTIKPGRYVYDVVIADQYNVKTRVIEGMVLVREGVTR